MKKHIALIGMAGETKKDIATKLCSKLEMMLFDCLDFVEYDTCVSAQELIKQTNVTYFKKKVSSAIKQLEDLQNMVFCSCDLTVMSVADLNYLLQHCFVIRLHASTETIKKCCCKTKPLNKLLQGENLDKLNIQSQKRYATRCDFAVDVSNISIDDAVDKILSFLQSC